MIYANVYAEKDKGVILILVERKSNFILMGKFKSKNSAHL